MPPTKRFSGELGATRAIPIAKNQDPAAGAERTAILDIPTLVIGGLLEKIEASLLRLEVVQEEILRELKRHTDALSEAVERPLEVIES